MCTGDCLRIWHCADDNLAGKGVALGDSCFTQEWSTCVRGIIYEFGIVVVRRIWHCRRPHCRQFAESAKLSPASPRQIRIMKKLIVPPHRPAPPQTRTFAKSTTPIVYSNPSPAHRQSAHPADRSTAYSTFVQPAEQS